MSKRLRVGVIGLGRRWPRYRRAMAALGDAVRITAVCDPRPRRAAEEAARLHCRAAGGVHELIEANDVEALLLPGGPWYGLWPVEAAARLGKPVLCTVVPSVEERHLDGLADRLGGAAGVHVVLWSALSLGLDMLGDRLAGSLGAMRHLQAAWTRRGETPRDGAGLVSTAALALFRGCAELFGEAPRTVRCVGSDEQPGFASVVLEFTGGQVAQLTLWDGPAARSRAHLHVEAVNGTARLELPGLLEWHDEAGRQRLELAPGLAEAVQVDRFVQAIRTGAPPACDLADARAALGWLRLARQSLAAGGQSLLVAAERGG